MAESSSRLLIVTEDESLEGIDALGAERVAPHQALEKIRETQLAAIAFPLQETYLPLADFLLRERPQVKKVLVGKPTSQLLLSSMGQGQPYAIVESFQSEELVTALRSALENFDFERQTEQLIELTRQQNEQLERLTTELEDRIDKREKNLGRSAKRMKVTSQRAEALHSALVAIHRARSVGEMENLLNQSLSRLMDLAWIRVVFAAQSPLQDQQTVQQHFDVFSSSLWIEDKPQGQILFARNAGRPFQKSEQDFLNQIGEAVSLSLDRLTKFEQAENLKLQWEATFDAISEPLCLADSEFKILRTNKAFSSITGINFKSLIGQDAFRAFLGERKDLNFKTGVDRFQVTRPGKKGALDSVYEVSCHRISQKGEANDLLLILFREVTDQQRMERQMLESAKLAELGTIGSSIAHELNNPLGGLISFLQLIKMDLPTDSQWREDIVEMESAGQRCKEIVENLLGFSRMQDITENQILDLREVIQHSVKIVEIQTRSMGVEITTRLPDHPVEMQGQFNPLAQALRNLLQNASEAVSQRRSQTPKLEGQITVGLTVQPEHYLIEVQDNGVGMTNEELKKIFNPLYTTKHANKNTGLGLTVAFQIIQQHQGQLEISSQPNIGTTARISFQRPDLPESRQVFDGKI